MALRFPRSVWAAILLAFVVVGSLRNAVAIPAFARKYGLPCSACHEAWPKLNSFGQTFKDNGYQLMNDRDAPIWQNPSYWPVAMRITPHWHYESAGRQSVDNPADPAGPQIEKTINTSGFDLTGIDIRSEEHTSELQSLTNLVCRLLLEKKKQNTRHDSARPARQELRAADRRPTAP